MRIQINARNRGFEFEARSRESVLYAGLRAGVPLPYECATGTCGTCKARLVSGRLRDGCPGVLRGARPLAPEVMAFGVELDRPRDFDAGQFMVLAAPGVDGYRAFSMVNFERGARRLDFVAKRKPGGGLSEWLFGARRDGEPLVLFGPLGAATFYPTLGRNLLCIAGGSGIAGMISILERGAGERYFERYRGWVFFGVRTLRDAFFLDELSSYTPGVNITVALSDEQVPATATQRWPALAFAHGLVHEVAGKAMAGKYENVRAYVAGPPPAVDAALRMLLLEAKLTSDNIRYDKYS